MGVRVWGVVQERLIELRVAPATRHAGIQIVGLPAGRTRTTGDRVRAALLNSGLVREAPSVTISLEPGVQCGTTSDLDLAIALASLTQIRTVGAGLRWILATGRLGLDATIHRHGMPDRPSLVDIVELLCRTPVVESEHMFGRGGT